MFANIRKLFTRKPKTVRRVKYIDWDKVSTVKDMVAIVKSLNLAVSVTESKWAEFEGLLKDEV